MRKLYPTYRAAASAVNDAFSAARIFRDSHVQIDARVQRIYDELNSKTPAGKWRYPSYVRYHTAGYISARYDDIWKHVEFCYRDADGALFSTHRDSTHRKTEEFYATGRGSELGRLESAHVWKGTDRNYTQWSRQSAEHETVEAK